MSTPYEKGVRVERLLKQELESQGWTVIRSAGSKGPADLVAWKYPYVSFMQVKSCHSIPELKRAIREAIDKFEKAGVFHASFIRFEIWLRYKARWLKLRRWFDFWGMDSACSDLLCQTEWPILEQEV